MSPGACGSKSSAASSTPQILINNCGTIDLCDIGPNIVVYPDNVILSGVKLKDVGRVVDYLAGGEIPQDLVLNRIHAGRGSAAGVLC